MSGFVSEQVFFLIGLTGETQVMIACVLNGLFHCIFRGRLFRKEDSLFLFSGSGNFLCIWKCGSDGICNVRFAHAAHHAVDADNILYMSYTPASAVTLPFVLIFLGIGRNRKYIAAARRTIATAVPTPKDPVEIQVPN